MEFILSLLTLFYADLRDNFMDTFLLITQRMLRFLMFLIWCALYPIIKLRSLRKPKYLPPIRKKVLLLPAIQLAKKIRRKELTSEEVVSAYIERCKEVNPILNAIVEARFEAAIHEAREVDKLIKTSTKTEEELANEMPLLGVPITVKESIAVKGMSHSVGVKTSYPVKADRDASVVTMARKAGAIVLLVSNTPELCMCWETYNNVTGITYNPYDTNRSSGGSSGGEAALLGSAGSVIGLASDIAGSVRLPALFCGVYGHKPTPRLVSCEGHKPDGTDKDWTTFFTIGLMTRYAEDLPFTLSVISQSQEANQLLKRKVPMKNIKFYILDSSSLLAKPPNREIKWALHKLKSYIESTHQIRVQKADFSEMKFAFNIATSILLGLQNVESICNTENKTRTWSSVLMEFLKLITCMSKHTFHVIVYDLLVLIVDKLPKKYKDKMHEKRSTLKKKFADLLGDNGVLIQPTFISSAYYPFETFHNTGSFCYLMIYNALGFPVTQCPMGLDDKGLPVGLQIVGNPGCDHLTIAVAQEIEKAFGGWRDPSSEKVV